MARSLSASSSPFMPGIEISDTTRSGRRRIEASTAAAPSGAVPMIWNSCVRSAESNSMKYALSSTSRRRGRRMKAVTALSLNPDEPQSAVYIDLEYLPLGHPLVITGCADGGHGPADHAHRIIRGDATPSLHLFDRVAPAIGGRRRRPVDSLAQWRPAVGATHVGVRCI